MRQISYINIKAAIFCTSAVYDAKSNDSYCAFEFLEKIKMNISRLDFI